MALAASRVVLGPSYPHYRLDVQQRRQLTPCRAVKEASTGRPLIEVQRKEPRRAAQPPAPVPVQHSSTYLIRGDEPEPAAPLSPPPQEEELFTGGAVQWALRKVDGWLADKEQNPSEADKAAWRLGSGPVGTSAAWGVSQAAQLSLKTGQKALQASIPVGKWAVAQSAGLAWRALRPPKRREDHEA